MEQIIGLVSQRYTDNIHIVSRPLASEDLLLEKFVSVGILDRLTAKQAITISQPYNKKKSRTRTNVSVFQYHMVLLRIQLE